MTYSQEVDTRKESEVTKEDSQNKPNPVGRPTKYSEEMQKKADDYIDNMKLFETYSKEVVVKDQIQVINLQRPSGIPSIAGLGLRLDVDRETLYTWGKKHPQFLGTLNRLRQKQAEFLEYHGLTKGYDSSFAKFIAVNTTDYRDKVETESKVETTVKMAYKID